MPTSIPYDPSLVLANIVDPDALANILKISSLQGPIDAAQETLNSLLTMRRSFDMTKTEILQLGIPTADLDSATSDLNKQIQDAAKSYVAAKLAGEKAIQPLRGKMQGVHSNVESPVDYVRTQIKQMPLSADSLTMDVQFFSLDENQQNSQSFASSISSYISESTSFMGTDVSSQMSAAAATQLSQQMQNHDITGTLVISANCTHKNACLLAPFALNVDKGIRVWNTLFPDDKIKMDDPASVLKIAAQDATADEKSFSIISGVTYGSSFVGMVHVLNTTDTTANERMTNVASTLQGQMDTGCWFESFSGGFGVSDTFANDVKNLLSRQNITSHVTVISMGIIPSIVAEDVQIAVQQFANFDPKSSMDAIAALSEATASEQNSVTSSANAARTGGQMVAMQSATIKSVLSALQPLQDGSNKMIDINSMMNGLQDFLTKAIDGQSGVPINYYLKDITAAMLAEMWVAKYLPGKYLTLDNDDLPPSNNGGGTGTGGGGTGGGTGGGS